MPKAPRRCPADGCTETIRFTRYCEQHTREKAWAGPRTASSISHQTTAWRHARPIALERDRYTCRINGPRCAGHATQVDLITPAAQGGPVTADNMQSVCHPCHVQKTRDERDVA